MSEPASGEISAVTALGRLLSDRAAREAFVADREAWAAQVTPDERPTILTLDASELDGQAQLLIDKRRGETSAFLERTVKVLGKRYPTLFQEFADTHPWPKGHLRHLHDALAFLAFIQRREPLAASGTDWALLNAHLRFRSGRRFFVGLSHHRDMGPLTMLSLTWSTRRGKLHTVLPLPFPAALGRRLFWGRDERP